MLETFIVANMTVILVLLTLLPNDFSESLTSISLTGVMFLIYAIWLPWMARNPQSFGLKDGCPIVIFMGLIATEKMRKMGKFQAILQLRLCIRVGYDYLLVYERAACFPKGGL